MFYYIFHAINNTMQLNRHSYYKMLFKSTIMTSQTITESNFKRVKYNY